MSMQNKLLIASNNIGKLNEFRKLLGSLKNSILIAPADIGLSLDPIENGSSYYENARIKAEAFAKASGLISLADDSGLAVDALGGRPGLYSARYAQGITDDKLGYLLHELEGVPMGKRTARFHCAVVVCLPSGEVIHADGICEGHIGNEVKGNGGFGYDPLFIVDGCDGLTMAEISEETKNKISHRAKAIQGILPQLKTVFS